MSHERQTGNNRLNFSPNERKYGRTGSVRFAKAMHLATTVVIIVRLGLNKRIKLVGNNTTAHGDYTDRTDRRTLIISSLEINSRKILHRIRVLMEQDAKLAY